MAELPDFSTMTKDEIGDWFAHTDTSALVAAAQSPSEPLVHVCAPEKQPVRVPRGQGVAAAADRRAGGKPLESPDAES